MYKIWGLTLHDGKQKYVNRSTTMDSYKLFFQVATSKFCFLPSQLQCIKVEKRYEENQS